MPLRLQMHINLNRKQTNMANKYILSGGGTGGHIFPAIAVARAIKEQHPNAQFLFIGAEGGMEMDLIPKAGFEIKAIKIKGFKRSFSPSAILHNIKVLFWLISSISKCKSIIDSFKPNAVITFGGYPTGPIGRAAHKRNIPLFLHESNALPGITNKLLAKHATVTMIGNKAAQKHLADAKKIVFTGNPIRNDMKEGNADRFRKKHGFSEDQPIIVSIGGSLGAGSINAAWGKSIDKISNAGIQLLWQTGKKHYKELNEHHSNPPKGIKLSAFIDNMADAYAAADLVVTRAGAISTSELLAVQKPSIIVPSPNVAEDHQTKNALSLVELNVAHMIPDREAVDNLADKCIAVLNNKKEYSKLTSTLETLPLVNALGNITEIIDQNS